MIITTQFVTDRLFIAKSNFTAAALPFTILKHPELIPNSLFLNEFLRHMATALLTYRVGNEKGRISLTLPFR
jgi:hypothetical protein